MRALYSLPRSWVDASVSPCGSNSPAQQPSCSYPVCCRANVQQRRTVACSAAAGCDGNPSAPLRLGTAAASAGRDPVGAASAATTAAAAVSLRFKAGRGRLTPLQRAAAAAHDALAAPSGPSTSAPAPAFASRVRTGRPTAVAAAAPPRPGQRPGSGPGPMPVAQADEGVEDEEEERKAEEQRRRFVGQLQAVPHVIPAAEQLGSARKRASRVTPSAGIKNAAEKERNRAARALDTLMKELSVPLGRYAAAFPDPARLHPFERALLGLTVGEAAYVAALQRVDRLRRAVQEVGKSAASRAANAQNKAAATAAFEEGCAAIEAVFDAGARHVDALKEVAKSLRGLPSLDSALPTLALVGAPNVGKSSLVQLLSSGTPEICNYPFTTRSIKMGHFYLDAQKHQVTDTPGLLRRPDSARNRMEALTLAALGCLDSAVLFVADLTEECGTSVADQWAIRSELRSRFPEKPWIDVLSKSDMLEDVFAEADALARTGSAAVGSSVGTATQMETEMETEEKGEGKEEEVESAAEMASRLPSALRISSLTHEGIPQLQLAIIRTLRAQAEQRRAAQQAEAERAEAAAQAAVAAQARPHGPAGGQAPPVGAGGKPPVLTFFGP